MFRVAGSSSVAFLYYLAWLRDIGSNVLIYGYYYGNATIAPAELIPPGVFFLWAAHSIN